MEVLTLSAVARLATGPLAEAEFDHKYRRPSCKLLATAGALENRWRLKKMAHADRFRAVAAGPVATSTFPKANM